MGANRKLQIEIDRTLKKVAEGIDTFDEIWEKVSLFLALSYLHKTSPSLAKPFLLIHLQSCQKSVACPQK